MSTGPSKATRLVAMAEMMYRLGCSLDGMPFAVEDSGPNVALSLRGRGGLRSALAASFYNTEDQAPGQNALSEALAVIEGKAMAAEREPVALRTGMYGDHIVLDLGRADGEVVVIGPGSWHVANRSPVLFRSTEAVGSLPFPLVGGDLKKLRTLVHVDDADWPVLVAFLVAALMPNLAHPVLGIFGEQGTAKTWVARLVVRTFDGSSADVQSAPRKEDDWAVVASASWSVAIDNISKIDAWVSDAICRACTGAQWRKRSLHTDDNLSILRIKRVIVVNGIDPEVTRGDLAERMVRLDLERITEDQRLTDEEIEDAFTAAHPEILGALCDLTAQVLAILPTTKVKNPPRMASFANVVAAVDAVLGTDGLTRYRTMVKSQVAAAAEGDLFAQALDAFVKSTNGTWTGSASDLLTAMGKQHDHRDLPRTPQAVGSALSRAATSLRAKGWTADQSKSGTRAWTLVRPADPDVEDTEGKHMEEGAQGVQAVQGHLDDGHLGHPGHLPSTYSPLSGATP